MSRMQLFRALLCALMFTLAGLLAYAGMSGWTWGWFFLVGFLCLLD